MIDINRTHSLTIEIVNIAIICSLMLITIAEFKCYTRTHSYVCGDSVVDITNGELVVKRNCSPSPSNRFSMREVLSGKAVICEVFVRKKVEEVLLRFSGQPSMLRGRREGEPPPLMNLPTTTQMLYVKDTRKPTTAP